MSECFKNVFVKSTRKPHECVCCGTKFPPGHSMHSYAGTHEGDFCHFYYCTLCDDLRDMLDWDWSEGIQDAREALADCGVIAAIKCPYYEMACTEVKSQKTEYYHKNAAEKDVPEFFWCDCENKPDEHCYNWDMDFIAGKINFICDCFTGERRHWSADIRAVVKVVAE